MQATAPLDWEIFADGEWTTKGYEEEGSNDMQLSLGPAKKQKWMMKRTKKIDYLYFDYTTEMPADEFLAGVSREEKDRWYPDLKKRLQEAEECGGTDGEDGIWYFIFSGPECGLYKNYTAFTTARDFLYQSGVNYASKKGTKFNSLEEAKTWIQGSRDEEGAYWGWPNPMPIFFA